MILSSLMIWSKAIFRSCVKKTICMHGVKFQKIKWKHSITCDTMIVIRNGVNIYLGGWGSVLTDRQGNMFSPLRIVN